MEQILILFLLFTKHLIVDFPLQTRYQWSNKHRYGHPGGLLHAGLHGVATGLIFLWFVYWPIAMLLALADMVVHYHIDWAKMNLNKKFNLAPHTHEQYWWLMGLDQYMHTLTYLGLVILI